MKYNSIFYLFLFFVSIFNFCTKNTNRVNFTINPENRAIVIPVHLNDSIIANMVFDACAYFTLDSSFCASNNLNLNMNNPDSVRQMGSAWTNRSTTGSIYNTYQNVRIGNINLTYHDLHVYNWKSYINSNDSEGMFGIPHQDTTHVWELNFEHNYMEIHSASNFKMPKNCFILPLQTNNSGYFTLEIFLPMKIKYADGDTLDMDHAYFIDTAMFWDMAIMYPAEEMHFFNKKEDAIWTQCVGGYNRHYRVNATLFDNFDIDSLRIYTFDDPQIKFFKYLIGQNFLKRFNVFFDLKNKKIGFQPIKNFKRLVNPLCKRYHYSTVKTQDGKNIVTKIGDYPNNYFKTAGLSKGDEIVAVNGLPYNNYSYDYLNYDRDIFIDELRNKNIIYEDYHFFKEDTLVFDIIRHGEEMKIVVPVDKNEEQGD